MADIRTSSFAFNEDFWASEPSCVRVAAVGLRRKTPENPGLVSPHLVDRELLCCWFLLAQTHFFFPRLKTLENQFLNDNSDNDSRWGQLNFWSGPSEGPVWLQAACLDQVLKQLNIPAAGVQKQCQVSSRGSKFAI